jgi:hypothetical protein
MSCAKKVNTLWIRVISETAQFCILGILHQLLSYIGMIVGKWNSSKHLRIKYNNNNYYYYTSTRFLLTDSIFVAEIWSLSVTTHNVQRWVMKWNGDRDGPRN